ncbi:hypothetical protein IEQ34_004732 [Dendrobium chrysotoxum]|uniref:RecQ mediated genome instability protein 1 OB-fold domain-containing protein n=1 Tax=Dendrobium chrysotoxum TaxID=161865 RepID=A0AAV7HI52_DENCH|nr:hypothetical protein IEQ34_004732 [Dendrobium chrysotoxum]
MTTGSSEAVLQTLISRGWCFRNANEVISLIQNKNLSSSLLVDSIESELLNMDLRFIGGKSLPEPSAAKKSLYIHGPKLVSVRDMRQSVIDSSLRSSSHQHRLLRFVLTDGQSEAIGIEYKPIPSITEEIIPGCKVRLENKISMHHGILCLNAGSLTIMGGFLQSLYDEWQMSRKYSGFSRSLMRLSQNDEGSGPPPFEKLQTEPCPRKVSHSSSSHGVGNTESHQSGDKYLHARNIGKDKAFEDPKLVSSGIKNEGKTSSVEVRTKEVIEAVPVQNQVAAQKLLQKMVQPMHEGRDTRGHKARLKGKQEVAPVFTLDEWERRKASSSKEIGMANIQNINGDEELARQLQSHLDMEDYQNHQGNVEYEADQIRMSMFNFGGAEERNDGRDEEGGGEGAGEVEEKDLADCFELFSKQLISVSYLLASMAMLCFMIQSSQISPLFTLFVTNFQTCSNLYQEIFLLSSYFPMFIYRPKLFNQQYRNSSLLVHAIRKENVKLSI